jgi:hypothetical protein
MMQQGVEMALSGDSAGAVHAINCGIGAYQSNGSTLMLLRSFAYLAIARNFASLMTLGAASTKGCR